MSFFIRNKSAKAKLLPPSRKRSLKTKKGKALPEPKKKKKIIPGNEEEIDSNDEDYGESADESSRNVDYLSSSEEDQETAQEKRLRLAKEYLAQLKSEEAKQEEEEEFGTDAIAHRLKQDVLEQVGKLHREVAHSVVPPGPADLRMLKGHQLPVTCVVITPDNKHVFSGSKDCSIIKWDVSTGKKVHVIHGGRKGTEKKHVGHTAHILCLAASSDGKYLASGDRNKLIHIWNPDDCNLLHTFQGHRGAVSGLAFRKGSHQLFSASHDRTVKHWDLNEMAYVETLFGHQDAITDIDSLTRERAITSGGRDCSIRIWKIIEESQLLFHGHSGSIDCVSLINEEHFVSGADDNSLALWGVMKKKPLVVVHNAHPGPEQGGDSILRHENWITAVASLQHTDLVVSGSKDGRLRFWRCDSSFRSLTPLFSVPLVGFVNSLQFSSDSSVLVAGVGQEHRLGRWWRYKEAKNVVCLVNLNKNKT